MSSEPTISAAPAPVRFGPPGERGTSGARLLDEVRHVALRSGLDAIGVADAAVFDRARHALVERRAAGLHGGMHFTYGDPEGATDPAQALPGARSLVVGVLSYRRATTGDRWAGSARVASYAWTDSYAALREALECVARCLSGCGWQTRVLADDNRLVDKEAAFRAGLGWYGKNTLLLVPGRGSWFVIGSVLTDAPLPASAERVADGCGSCTRCVRSCPTGAIEDGVLDARRCLAWLLEAPGWFPREHREALGDRLYGCDDCQESCPVNVLAERRERPGAAEPGAEPWVDPVELLRSDDAGLLARFGRWYVPKRQARYLRRNALVVLGNVGDGRSPEVEDVLRSCLASPDPIVRGHAAWAAGRLRRPDLLPAAHGEDDPLVHDEIEAARAGGGRG